MNDRRRAEETSAALGKMKVDWERLAQSIRLAGHESATAVLGFNVAVQRGVVKDAERRGGQQAERARKRLLHLERVRDQHARRAPVVRQSDT